MTLPVFLKPKKSYKLKRLGKNNDGGYLIGTKSLKESKSLISFGIGNDCSFENDFSKYNKNIRIVCYDNFISKNYLFKQIIKSFFFEFNIIKTYLSAKILLNFFIFFSKHKLIKKHIRSGDIIKIIKVNKLKPPLLFKIDIENSEYSILNDLIKIKNKISGLIIEFHNVEKNLKQIKNFINKISLELIHIHPNNYGKTDLNNNPSIIELTFEKKPLIKKKRLQFPNELDQKNSPDNEDIILRFKKN